MLTSRRPDLRAPIVAMLDPLVAAVRASGEVSLTTLVEAVVGDKLTQVVRERLEQREAVRFEQDGDATRFSNEGPALRIQLKRFDLLLPARLAGSARIVDGDGVALVFERGRTLVATKLLLRVGVERVEVSPRRVVVGMETAAFSQCLVLVP